MHPDIEHIVLTEEQIRGPVGEARTDHAPETVLSGIGTGWITGPGVPAGPTWKCDAVGGLVSPAIVTRKNNMFFAESGSK